MEIAAKKFPYDTNAITEKAFHEHIKLYQGYVGKVNSVTKELIEDGDRSGANATYSKYRGLKRGESYALGGAILHEAYFMGMTRKKMEPCAKTLKLLDKCFGGYENWLKDFLACGAASRGWCILSWEQRTQSMRNLSADLHDDGIVSMAYPLLVLDVYEHAYFMDYGTDKDTYMKKFLESVNWNSVETAVEQIG